MWKILGMILLVIGTYQQIDCIDPGCAFCPFNPNICFFCKQWEGYQPAAYFYPSGTACCDTNAGSYSNGQDGCTFPSSLCSLNGCLACPLPSICQACNTTGFELSGAICCDTNAGQYPDGNGGCAPCALLIPGCNDCTVNNNGVTECKACDTSQYFALSGGMCCNTVHTFPDGSGGCVACNGVINGCSICVYQFQSSQTQCMICQPGFSLFGTACRNDNIPTRWHDDDGVCTSCYKGYVVSNGDWGENGKCTSCLSGFYRSRRVPCDVNQGSFPDGEGGCGSCSDLIQGCVFCDYEPAIGFPFCVACQTDLGYVQSAGICCNLMEGSFPDGLGGCGSCSSVINGCFTCEYSQVAGATQCIICGVGFQLSIDTCCDGGAGEYPDGDGGCTE